MISLYFRLFFVDLCKMFKRKTLDIDLANKIDLLDNKLDILSSKLLEICHCRDEDKNLYKSITNYIDTKFRMLLEDQEDKIQVSNKLSSLMDDRFAMNQRLDSLQNALDLLSSENSSIVPNLKDLLKEVAPIDHQEYHIKHQHGLNNIRTDFTSLLEVIKKQDEKLRTDLHNFLLGLETNIVKSLKDKIDVNVDQITQIQSDLKTNFYTMLKNVDDKVDGFYFDNELVKHQLSLEEDIRMYNDDIESMKIAIQNKTIEIDNIIQKYSSQC